MNQNILPLPKNPIMYNQINTSSFNFDSIANGHLTLLTLDSNININLPIATNYSGIVIELIVSNILVPSSNATISLTNIMTNKTSPIILSTISDKIKLLGTLNGWLVI